MSSSIKLLLVLALVAGACGGDDSGETPTTTVTSPTTASDNGATLEPHEVAERLSTAISEGDAETALSYFAQDAVVTGFDGDSDSLFEENDDVRDDFDGDGSTTDADGYQFGVASGPAMMLSHTWECATTSQDQAECTVTTTSGFTKGGPDPSWTDRVAFRIEAGKIAEERQLSDPAQNFSNRYWRTLHAYERWVKQTYPDQWSELFHEPCCNAEFILMPSAIPLHEELIPEYLNSR